MVLDGVLLHGGLPNILQMWLRRRVLPNLPHMPPDISDDHDGRLRAGCDTTRTAKHVPEKNVMRIGVDAWNLA
jgi:hypothetical protein